jgi:hypothetical protein
MHKRRVRRSFLVLAVVLVMATIAGCSSSPSTITTTTTATASSNGSTSSSGAAKGTPVVIGSIAPLSGSSLTQPENPVGVQLAADAINGSGGINGHPIKVVSCDDQNNPNTAADCGREMVSDHAVLVVAFSAEGDSFMPILEAAHIPEMSGFPASADEATFANSFPVDAGGQATVGGSAALCAKFGAKKIGIGEIDVAAAGTLIPFAYAGIAPFGLSSSNTFTISVAVSATSYSSYAAALSSSNCVINDLEAIQQVLIARGLRQQGATMPDVFAGGVVTPSQVKEVSPTTGLYDTFTLPLPSFTQAPGMQAFSKDLAAYPVPSGTPMNTGLVAAWASVMLAAKYLATLSQPTGAGLIAALDNAGTVDYPPLPTLTFNHPVVTGERLFTHDLIFVHYNSSGTPVPYLDGAYVDYLSLKTTSGIQETSG